MKIFDPENGLISSIIMVFFVGFIEMSILILSVIGVFLSLHILFLIFN